MKKYKLLKDLPFSKAGDIFKGELEHGTIVLYPEDYENYKHKLSSDEFWDFDEWFEEVVEEFYYIDEKGFVTTLPKNYRHADIHLRQAIGNYFKTEEEAEKHLAYLKAKEVIRQDAKGFKPDWTDEEQMKFSGYWKKSTAKLDYTWERTFKSSTIYFKSIEDIEESLKEHSGEWIIYLTYEQ